MSLNEPLRYDVRLTEPAEAQAEAAFLGRMRFGQKSAEDWYAGLGRALESLAQFPGRFPFAPESDVLGGDVRQMLYGKGRAAYRVLYRIIAPQEGEPGLVRVMHIRHALLPFMGTDDNEE